MKLLHTADIHLREKEHLDTLSVIIKTANENGCDTLLVCGDLFDKEGSFRELAGLIPKVLEEFRGEVLILPGNHDAEALKGKQSLSSNSTVLASDDLVIRRKMDNFELIAVPYRDGLCFKDIGPVDCDPDSSLLMAHGSYYSTDFFYEDSKDYFPMFEEDLRDRFRYVALGHYHKPVRLKLGRTVVINPGSPRPTRDTDTGKRYAALIDTAVWKTDLVPLDVPFYEKITVNVNYQDSPEMIEAKISAQVPHGLAGQPVEKLIVAFIGILPDKIEPAHLKTLAGSAVKAKAGPKINVQTEPEALRFIDSSLLQNAFVRSFLDELAATQDSPEKQDRIRSFAMERISSLFR